MKLIAKILILILLATSIACDQQEEVLPETETRSDAYSEESSDFTDGRTSSQPLYFFIINKVNGRYLDGTQPPGDNVYANSTFFNNDNQSWELVHSGDADWFYIRNKVNGRYLDNGGGPSNNVYAQITGFANDNQKWRFVYSGDLVWYYIENKLGHGYLDGTQPPGDNVYANPTQLNNDNQKWALRPTSL